MSVKQPFLFVLHDNSPLAVKQIKEIYSIPQNYFSVPYVLIADDALLINMEYNSVMKSLGKLLNAYGIRYPIAKKDMFRYGYPLDQIDIILSS